MRQVIALVDCTHFYVSVERAFDASIQQQPQEVVQPDLFGGYQAEQEQKKARLMRVIDEINQRYRDLLFFGAQGLKREWQTKQRFRSPRYTTHWSDLLTVT